MDLNGPVGREHDEVNQRIKTKSKAQYGMGLMHAGGDFAIVCYDKVNFMRLAQGLNFALQGC